MGIQAISMQVGYTVQFPVVLISNNGGGTRFQRKPPNTTIKATNTNVIEAKLQIVNDVLVAQIKAVAEGTARVRISSGGRTTVIVNVLDNDPATAWILKTNEALVVEEPTPVPIDPFPPNSVDGPNASENGEPFWIQRDADSNWFVWWNIDGEPAPDVKKPLDEFLVDENIDQAYRDDVGLRAAELGYAT